MQDESYIWLRQTIWWFLSYCLVAHANYLFVCQQSNSGHLHGWILT